MSISPVVRQAESFQDLLALPGGDGPYQFTTIFRESTWRERRNSQKKLRLLKRIDGEVREAVQSGERVFFFTTARGLSFWEKWVLGWRRVVVLTDSRLVLLQADPGGWPRALRCQLPYGAVAGVEAGRWGRLRIDLKSGESLVLQGVPGADLEAARDMVLKAAAKADAGRASDLEDLCPHCHVPLDGRPARCYRCRGRLKRPWLAALLSLLVPGLGNRYLGYKGFAVLEFLAAAAIWLAYWVGTGMWGFPGVPGVVRPEWVFLAVHGTDALWTWYVGRRGIYPVWEKEET